MAGLFRLWGKCECVEDPKHAGLPGLDSTGTQTPRKNPALHLNLGTALQKVKDAGLKNPALHLINLATAPQKAKNGGLPFGSAHRRKIRAQRYQINAPVWGLGRSLYKYQPQGVSAVGVSSPCAAFCSPSLLLLSSLP